MFSRNDLNLKVSPQCVPVLHKVFKIDTEAETMLSEMRILAGISAEKYKLSLWPSG